MGDALRASSATAASLARVTATEDDASLWPANPVRRYLRQTSVLNLLKEQEEDDDDDNWLDNSIALLMPRVHANLPYHWWQDDSNNLGAQQQQHHHSLAIPHDKLQKTGTTICGVVCGDATCVLAADTRATASNGGGSMLVADARARKLHVLTQTSVAAGAGTSADLQHLTRQAAISLALQERLQDQVGNAPCSNDNVQEEDDNDIPSYLAKNLSVESVCRWLQQVLWENGGNIQANLIVGGLDPHTGRAGLYALHPHGSMDRNLAYTALGSGGHAAMSILESRYRPDLTKAEAIQLVRDAIQAGIANDLGSGSQIDVCILDGTITAKNGDKSRMQYIRSQLPDDDESSSASSLRVDATAGVNGFGNHGLHVQRRRTLYDPDAVQQRQEAWQHILDL